MFVLLLVAYSCKISRKLAAKYYSDYQFFDFFILKRLTGQNVAAPTCIRSFVSYLVVVLSVRFFPYVFGP